MSEIKRYTILIFTENKPGVLYRIADLFLKRKINIESLTVSEVEAQDHSRFTVVVFADTNVVEKIVKQLYKIIEVTKVLEKTDDQLVFCEVALIKVATKNTEQRKEVESFVSLFDAKILAVGGDFLTIEKSGTEESIESLYARLKPFGIKEYVRSGRIAVVK